MRCIDCKLMCTDKCKREFYTSDNIYCSDFDNKTRSILWTEKELFALWIGLKLLEEG